MSLLNAARTLLRVVRGRMRHKVVHLVGRAPPHDGTLDHQTIATAIADGRLRQLDEISIEVSGSLSNFHFPLPEHPEDD